MPLATSSRTYESPDFGPLAAGPSNETLDEITLQPGSNPTDLTSPGATLLFVLDGQVDVQPGGGQTTALGSYDATMLQPGSSTAISDGSTQPAHVLEVEVIPAPAGS